MNPMDSLKRLAGWVGDRIAPLNWDTMFLVKTAVTVAIIVGVSEIVKRSPSIGALIVALPFTSILVMIWMQVEGQPASKIATHSSSTFWFVLPTLPMFLVLPKLLEAKWNFYLALLACCALTTALFFAMEWIQGRLSS
ncbi:DUF3147 family protein [bacterium]|nr:DUF3147 family protein [bacterium]MDC3254842.1 DUF3147 family protein [bacterium]